MLNNGNKTSKKKIYTKDKNKRLSLELRKNLKRRKAQAQNRAFSSKKS